MINAFPVPCAELCPLTTVTARGQASCITSHQSSFSGLLRARRKPARHLAPIWLVLAAAGLAMVAGPGQALAQRPLGVDVSSYQGGSINWTSVKGAGISFAWTKATEGTGYIDADFVTNENGGKAAGVYMGAYHYAHPELNTPAVEASYFWNEVSGYIKADGLTLMPMLDIEGSAFNANVGATSLSDWVNQWCTDVVQDAANNGVSIKPIIYISACNAVHLDTSVAQWFCDIADYNGESPTNGTPWSTCTSYERWGSGVWNFWQYSSCGSHGRHQQLLRMFHQRGLHGFGCVQRHGSHPGLDDAGHRQHQFRDLLLGPARDKRKPTLTPAP